MTPPDTMKEEIARIMNAHFYATDPSGDCAIRAAQAILTQVVEPIRRELEEAREQLYDARACEEIVIELRDEAARITGGNCTGADDDLAVLSHLADRAVKAGLTDELHWQIQKHAADREERNKYRTAEGVTALLFRTQAAESSLSASRSECERLRGALEGLLSNHVQLVSCGDCGNWDVEAEPEVIAARQALKEPPPHA